jgi:hypothetical protein
MKDSMLMRDWILVMGERLKMDSANKRDGDGSSRSAPCMPGMMEGPDLNKRYVDITAMIRSLQRTEGSADCFRSGLADCDQMVCAWRQYCLGKPDDLLMDSDA